MQRNDVQCEMHFGGGIVIFTGLERLVATSFRRRLFFQISKLSVFLRTHSLCFLLRITVSLT